MAQDLVMDMRARQQGIRPDLLPFIEWERLVNPGLGAGQDEKPVREKMPLCDQNGSPFVWVDEANINHYLRKGWKIVGCGNLDFKTPNGTLIPQIQAVRMLIENQARGFAASQYQQATIAAQNAELEELRAFKAKADAEQANLANDEKTPQGALAKTLAEGQTGDGQPDGQAQSDAKAAASAKFGQTKKGA